MPAHARQASTINPANDFRIVQNHPLSSPKNQMTTPPRMTAPSTAAIGSNMNHGWGRRSRTISSFRWRSFVGNATRREYFQPQPSSWRRRSPMPKWWATSWTTVTCT